ncbi:MAG: guanine deaminase [Nanoarchaeota archaeon]|nr:guanine deaminase [Nanoarchaeota archaeon]
MSKVIKSNFINPVSEENVEVLRKGFLQIDDNGNIITLQQDRPNLQNGDKLIELEDKVIIPGFIDVHLHLPQYQFLGEGKDTELLLWLDEHAFPAESSFEYPDLAEIVARNFFEDLLSHGTTTASIYSTIHEEATNRAFKVAYDKGIRAFIGKVMMDTNSPPQLTEKVSKSLDASLRLAGEWDKKDNGRLRYIFTPRFVPTCTGELLRKVGELINSNGTYAQTHLSENIGEIEFVKELHPWAKSYTHVYERYGLLGEKVIMAHCIHLSDEEVKLLKETKTNIAHCPYSNENLRSGVMPYFRWKDRGLTMALGTDIAGGPSISMPEQMGKAIETSRNFQDGRVISPTEAFYLATLGGARVLSIDNVTGNLEAGKEADFVVIDPKRIGIDISKGLDLRILGNLAAIRGNGFIGQTYVRGKQVYSRK